MAAAEAQYVDHAKFLWVSDLMISEPQVTFRQLLSPQLITHMRDADCLDNKITEFGYTPCTQLYLLGDSEEKMFINICIGTNLIDEIHYDMRDGQSIELKFCDHRKALVVQTFENNDFMKRKTTFVPFDAEVYKEASTVNQEVLDSLRIKCDGKIVTKDGIIV